MYPFFVELWVQFEGRVEFVLTVLVGLIQHFSFKVNKNEFIQGSFRR